MREGYGDKSEDGFVLAILTEKLEGEGENGKARLKSVDRQGVSCTILLRGGMCSLSV